MIGALQMAGWLLANADDALGTLFAHVGEVAAIDVLADRLCIPTADAQAVVRGLLALRRIRSAR